MSTLSKRTLLILLIVSVSFGSIFAEGQADMFDNDGDYSTEDIENGSFNGFSGAKGQSRSRGNDGLKYADAPGVLVTDIFVGSPADSAGILRGDVIVSVEDVDVSTIYDMTLAIEGYNHGQDILLVLLRADEEIEISLTLESRIGYPLIGITGIGAVNSNRNGMSGFNSYPMPRSRPDFMFEFEDDENDDLDNMMDIPEDVIEAVIAGNAALITEVVEGSPAEEAGISAHMIVIALDGNNLEAGDLSGAVLAYEIGDTVELTLADMSGVSTLEVVLGENNGNPFLGVAYIPLDLGGQGFRMPSRPNMVIPKMNNN